MFPEHILAISPDLLLLLEPRTHTVEGQPVDQQVLSGAVENYRSNLLLSMIASGAHAGMFDSAVKPAGWSTAATEQQMIMKELSGGSPDAEADIQTLAGTSHGRLPPLFIQR